MRDSSAIGAAAYTVACCCYSEGCSPLDERLERARLGRPSAAGSSAGARDASAPPSAPEPVSAEFAREREPERLGDPVQLGDPVRDPPPEREPPLRRLGAGSESSSDFDRRRDGRRSGGAALRCGASQ